MFRHTKTSVIALLAISLTAIAIACGGSSDEETPGAAKLDVLTTIYPLTHFTERIGGDRVDVTSIIKPGVEAHDFEPTPGDIRAIGGADVLIYNHPSFETWVEDAIDTAGSDELIVVKAADLPDETGGTPTSGDGHDHEDGDIDPHVWLNPIETVEQVRAIEAALAQADADGAAMFKTNADALVAELEKVDEQFAEGLASCQFDEMVVSHLAYGHLAERYDLHQLGLSGLSPDFDSGPQQITSIIDEMRELGIMHILQEPISDDRLAETVANETGATVLPLHPLESLTNEEVDAGETYFTVMAKNLESLRTALVCE